MFAPIPCRFHQQAGRTAPVSRPGVGIIPRVADPVDDQHLAIVSTQQPGQIRQIVLPEFDRVIVPDLLIQVESRPRSKVIVSEKGNHSDILRLYRNDATLVCNSASGRRSGTRTPDQEIKSLLLYQLS